MWNMSQEILGRIPQEYRQTCFQLGEKGWKRRRWQRTGGWEACTACQDAIQNCPTEYVEDSDHTLLTSTCVLWRVGIPTTLNSYSINKYNLKKN